MERRCSDLGPAQSRISPSILEYTKLNEMITLPAPRRVFTTATIPCFVCIVAGVGARVEGLQDSGLGSNDLGQPNYREALIMFIMYASRSTKWCT